MNTRTKLESQIKKAGKRLKAPNSKRIIAALRAKAAGAALHWVISHEDRVNAFRASVKDTPVEKALDALLEMLKNASGGSAGASKPASKARKAAPRKKPAAKKPVKKAVKKVAKKAARRR